MRPRTNRVTCEKDTAIRDLLTVDFHVHTSASHDAGIDPARLIEVARGRGLDAVAVCDHNTIAGALVARELTRQTAGAHARHDDQPADTGQDAQGDAGGRGRGLFVVVGEEVRTSEGEIIGWFLEDEIPAGLSPEETIALIHEQGGLACVPHPFDRYRASPLGAEALERVAGDIDAIEGFNARNLTQDDNLRAQEWADVHGLPVVAGSDAHIYSEIGTATTRLSAFDDAESLRGALTAAEIGGGPSGLIPHVYTAVRKRLPTRGKRD